MELKNAVAVCLISLFSATLVVLIARALDSQAASRLEPQLASIVEELQAIRKQGGMPAAPTTAARSESVDDGLIVYYFHGNTRCPTCQSIESQAKDSVHTDFAAQLTSGEIVWKVLNYEQPAVSALAKKFEIQMPVVVLAKMRGGRLQDWKRLDEVWALVGDKPGFAAYVRREIQRVLGTTKDAARAASLPQAEPPQSASAAPVLPAPAPADLPLPKPHADLPLPK
ncbi:MAG: nitrophenyl compound nitroreductase subunit ArsF family protein [Thermoguttaceae bacterium]